MATPNHSNYATMQVYYDDIYLHPSFAHWSSYSNPSSLTYSFYDVLNIVSQNTPGFRHMKRSQLPFHNYGKVVDRFDDPGTVMVQTRHDSNPPYDRQFVFRKANVLYNVSGSLLGFSMVPADDPTAGVTSNLLSKLSLGKTSAAVTLAEAHKTAAMVADTANRIVRAIKAAREANLLALAQAIGFRVSQRQRKRFNRRKREYYDPNIPILKDPARAGAVERFAAQTWLEYSYGWKPLLNDVYNSAEALSEVMTENQSIVRSASARGKGTVSTTLKTPVRNWVLTNVVTREISVKMEVFYRIPDGGVSVVDAFGLQNPYIVAWELLPFSFVADWFIPIGKALENLTATNGLQFVGGYTVTKRTDSSDATYTPGSPWFESGSSGPYWTADSGNMKFVQRRFEISRTGMGTFPSVQFPSFKDPRSFAHAASAIALLSALWRK